MTPVDVYLGRAEEVLAERDRINRITIVNRCVQHCLQAGSLTLNPDGAEPPS